MLVLKILGIIIVVILGITLFVKCLKKINSFYREKFGISLVSLDRGFLTFLSGVFLAWGYKWYQASLINNEDILNGIVIAVIGGMMGLIVIAYVYARTNFIFGTLSLLFHAIILLLGLKFGIYIFIFFFIAILGLIFGNDSEKVYVRKY